MEQIELGPPLHRKITVTRRTGARRVSLRISRVDQTIRLTAPPQTSLGFIRDFVHSRQDWLARHLADMPQKQKIHDGMPLSIAGQELCLKYMARRGARQVGQYLELNEARPKAALLAFLKEQARAAFQSHCDHFAVRLQRRYHRLTLRDPRTRWGSCSSRGHLMFSWRVIMAPPTVLRYLAAHEMAHLEHMNHSPAFWGIVAQLDPEWQSGRRWLREKGERLHLIEISA